jgi:hypothetical protein
MPVTASPNPLPSRSLTQLIFDAACEAWFTYWPTAQANLNALETNVNAKSANCDAKSTAADASATAALGYQNAAATSAANAASSAGAAPWVSGNTYANGVSTRSPANQRVYLKITATAGGAVDPSANATDWLLANAEMPTVFVTTATQTMLANYRYVILYAGVCALTAPSTPNDRDEIAAVPANGFTNTIDYGAKVVIGPTGVTGTGVMNMNVGAERDIYSTTLAKWIKQ